MAVKSEFADEEVRALFRVPRAGRVEHIEQDPTLLKCGNRPILIPHPICQHLDILRILKHNPTDAAARRRPATLGHNELQNLVGTRTQVLLQPRPQLTRYYIRYVSS